MAARARDISVVVASFNRAHLVTRALDSVARQAEPPREVIVVDDASTDGTSGVVRAWAKHAPFPVRLIATERNRGAGAARNLGIAAARGEFVALLDSDDEYLPHALARLAAPFARFEDCVVSFADAEVRFADGRPSHRHIARHLAPGRGVSATSIDGLYRLDDPTTQLLTTSYIPTCSAMFRRAAATAIGGMPEQRFGEDWLFWLRLTGQGAFFCRFEDASIVHRQGDNATDEANALANTRQVLASLVAVRRGDHVPLDAAQCARLDREIAAQAAIHRYFASREGLAAYWRELRALAPDSGLGAATSLFSHPRDLARALRFTLRR